jgi:gluconokinase
MSLGGIYERPVESKAKDLDPIIVALDVGTSSVRALLFDSSGRQLEGCGVQLPYEVEWTADGGVEVGADRLVGIVVEAVSALHQQMQALGIKPSTVACCTFWHNVLGVDHEGRPTTPVLHPFDTRAARAAAKLAKTIDGRSQHARTGCVLHASYLPAKLLWLSEERSVAFRATRRWMSFGEYLFLRFLGEAVGSVSMVSGSGLWDQNRNQYDAEILKALPVEPEQLCAPDRMDQPLSALRDEFKPRWPLLDGIPWYPALGDGACNNLGSDCHSPDRFALMVGTSGAMRAVWETAHVEIPEGLWCYRVDRRRFVLGGALSNGGEVYAWMKRTLNLPPDENIEEQLGAIPPGSHRLTILPLLAGERSPHWRADATAAIIGLRTSTRPIEILRAGLESVALRFRTIYNLMTGCLGTPKEVIASGGALLHSVTWTQIMAGALARPIVASLETEPSSRGAALVALERLGAIHAAREAQGRMGSTFKPVASHCQVYEEQLRRQEWLYSKLYGGKLP